jgi:hypothetical protein
MDIDHCFWFVVLFCRHSENNRPIFKAITTVQAPNGLVLTGSLIISDFAKSITNAANLDWSLVSWRNSICGLLLSLQ